MKAPDLLRALLATGITQYRIAKDSGISQPTLSRISSGQPDCMTSTLEKLKKLCHERGIETEGAA
ncbi:MAG: helix-turn-helix domain-containing protein [bacterium]|nr:helix-turn-helix domain-containing protein [bacterium]